VTPFAYFQCPACDARTEWTGAEAVDLREKPPHTLIQCRCGWSGRKDCGAVVFGVDAAVNPYQSGG